MNAGTIRPALHFSTGVHTWHAAARRGAAFRVAARLHRDAARQCCREDDGPGPTWCAAFDFGVFPEETDWATFAAWREIFDRFPLPDSPGYHAFRHWYGWEPVPMQRRLRIPPWKAADLHEGRADLCEDMV